MKVENYRLQSLALVFERCNDSLKNHIFKNEMCKPWKTRKAVARTLQWSKQILDALEFIHGMAMVHRDLKLDNVLVSVLWLNCRSEDGLNVGIILMAKMSSFQLVCFFLLLLIFNAKTLHYLHKVTNSTYNINVTYKLTILTYITNIF